MDLRKLKTLIDLVAESGIAELEVTEGDGKVRIVKSAAQIAGQPTHMQSTVIGAPAGSAPFVAAASVVSEPIFEGDIVKSPMVGTFYRSAAPGKPPYVELGQAVKASDPVCIIEAMKLLNEIEAGFDGVVKEILVENGQPVEFGQPLLIIG